MAPHSSTLAWKIPRTEEPGRLQSLGSRRVVHDWATSLSLFTFTFHFHALEKEMATHSSVLAWRIPGTGEPGGLPSMGSHRVGHSWSDLAAAELITFWLESLKESSWTQIGFESNRNEKANVKTKLTHQASCKCIDLLQNNLLERCTQSRVLKE